MTDAPERFLIEKRGLYYRPNAQGYTGLKSEAGRYSFEEAAERVGPNGPDGPQDGLGMWRESEAPEFSTRCPWDLRLERAAYQRGLEDAAKVADHHKVEALKALDMARPDELSTRTGCQSWSRGAEKIAAAIRALAEQARNEID